MDRFIVTTVKINKKIGDYLKSNMDRFIAKCMGKRKRSR